MCKKIIIKFRSYGIYYVGDLFINGVLFCNVIINRDKFGQFPYKLYHDYKLRFIDGTCKYSIFDDDDSKFNNRGFQIHCGNSVNDSKGCVLIGYASYIWQISQFDYALLNMSRLCFQLFKQNICKGDDYVVKFISY